MIFIQRVTLETVSQFVTFYWIPDLAPQSGARPE
jgi:hypothetical protein